jgi:hypothetical protein
MNDETVALRECRPRGMMVTERRRHRDLRTRDVDRVGDPNGLAKCGLEMPLVLLPRKQRAPDLRVREPHTADLQPRERGPKRWLEQRLHALRLLRADRPRRVEGRIADLDIACAEQLRDRGHDALPTKLEPEIERRSESARGPKHGPRRGRCRTSSTSVRRLEHARYDRGSAVCS